VHPDWGLIHGLRTRLADEGYTTLSVQMPVLAADAKPEDYPATFPEAALRLARAAEFLRVEGHDKIALVSHSMGARMADYFLARHSKEKVKAWVAIGMTGENFRRADNSGAGYLWRARSSRRIAKRGRTGASSQEPSGFGSAQVAGRRPLLQRA
jgi:pimeloyl-ACP methyl ester carboxylesterase